MNGTGEALDAMSSMSKGDGIDGRARRWSYAGRLEARLWILTQCTAAALHLAPACRLCLAKHRPWKRPAACCPRNPAGNSHALSARDVRTPGDFVLDSKRAIQVRSPSKQYWVLQISGVQNNHPAIKITLLAQVRGSYLGRAFCLAASVTVLRIIILDELRSCGPRTLGIFDYSTRQTRGTTRCIGMDGVCP